VKKLLLLIPIIVLIIGCGGDDVTNYFPLTVGNEWNYDMTMTMTDPDTTITETGTVELEITAETTLDNDTEVFEMIMIMTENTTTFADTSYIEETEDYLLQYSNKAATVPNDTMLALPLETGKTWDDYEVMGQKNVTVPAGTFNDCWEIRGVDEDTMYMYVAPNVGMVKMSQKGTEPDTTSYEMLMELETYTIK